MNCFYCSKPSVAICRCSSINICADHIVSHGSNPYDNHSFTGTGPEFQSTKAKVIQRIINNNYKSIQKRKFLLITETCLIIKRIKELSYQAFNIISEAERKCLIMLEKIQNLDLGKIISQNWPLNITKKCVLDEIESYYSQDFVSQSSLQQNWRSFLENHSPSYNQICLSDNQKYVFAGGDDHTVRMWKLSSKTLEHTFIGHLHRVMCVAATKKQLISGSFDRTIRLWRLSDNSLRAVLKGHEKGVTCLTIVENNRIVSGSYDCSIRVWSINNLTQQYVFTDHSSYVWDIVVARNGQSIISCCYNKTIKIWNLSSRSESDSFDSADPLSCIALSQDGNTLYSGSFRGNIENGIFQVRSK